MNHNSFTGVGRLAAPPVFTPGKKQLGPDGVRTDDRIWARLAVNRPKVNGKDTGTDYFPLCAWGRLARVFMNHCVQGKEILVRGVLRTNPKQRPDKTWDNYTEIVVHEVVLGNAPRDKGNVLDAAPVFNPAPQVPQAVQGVDPAQIDALTTMIVAAIQQEIAKEANTATDQPFVS